MYCDFYHLSEKPFNITPDPKFLYLNARYREALATLNYGISERKGFITLIGEAGTGKTTLLNKLLDQLDEKTKTVFIFNTNVTFEEILEYIFNEFDLPVHSGKKLYMLQRLNAFLLEELRGGGNVAVLIDEAQDLDITVLENLRLLSNLETAKEKILQIVLSGQPELQAKLSSPELRQLRQRIAVNCRLTPLTRDELSEYIEFRLHAAGCADPKMFTREAEEQVWQYSHGIPRLVNVVCDNALVIGYALGKKRIGADIVREASADLLAAQGPPPIEVAAAREDPPQVAPAPMPPPAPRTSRGTWALFGLVAAALLVGFLSMGRTLLRQSPELAQPPAGGPRTILHPGQHVDGEELPPARLGVDGVDDPGRTEPDSRLGSPSDTDRVAAVPAPAEPAVSAPGAAFAALPAEQPPPAPPAERPAIARGAPQEEPVAPEAAEPAPAPEPEREAPPPVAPAAAAPPPVPADDLAARARRIPDELLVDDAEVDVEAVPQALEAPPARPERPPVDGVRLAASGFDRITVQEGDSFAQIAVRKYGQSSYTILDLLKLANPEVQDVNRIAAGQTLELPRLAEGFSILQQEGRGYGVLVFSSPSEGRVQSLAKALRKQGFAVQLSTGSIGPGRTLQRVLIGPFASEADAAAASRDVRKAFRENEQLAALGRS